MLIKNKIVKILVILILIHIVWSVYLNITVPYKDIDNEALIPCLFYLPPLGFFVIGLIIIKILEVVFAAGLIRKLFRKRSKK